MNRRQLLALAQREVERRRLAAVTEADARRQLLLESSPELAALVYAQAEAGAQAARLAADGHPNEAQARLEEVASLAARRAALLAAMGMQPEELEPRYHCHLCSDSGRRFGRLCTCVQEEAARLRREEVNQAGPLQLCRFENFSTQRYPERLEGVAVSPRVVMQNILQDCRDWAESFGPRSESLLMYGDAGLGKTHLALSIASVVLEGGHDVIYVSAQSAFAEMAEHRGERGERGELFDTMLRADLLVLDDLGTEYLDAWLLSKLYELVNGRMGRRPTIYTTNIVSQNHLSQRYTEKIASRLLGDCRRMRFFGNDLRLERQ